MARKLNAKQKRLLDSAPRGTISFDDLPVALQKQIEDANMFEDLWSACERYLWDKSMDERYGK